MKEFEVAKTEAGVRADIFVASQYPNFSRSALETLFDKNFISINSEPAKPSQRIKTGDLVTINESLLRSEPPKIKLPILYEDKDVTVVNKQAGILTHSKGALNLEATVASFIKPKVKKIEGNRAGIVHRLDRGTSGVIITAKHPEALSHLQKQFAKRKAKKIYLAIVEGKLDPEAAIIDAPIMRNPTRPQTFKIAAGGKPAITQYQVIKTFNKGGKDYSLVELKPQTGRTHQLRVHMTYVGHPIVGDLVYGKGGSEPLMLHAQSLEITLPTSERQIFTADLPKNIREFANV